MLKLIRMMSSTPARSAPFALLLVALHAHAAWTLVEADTPATAIHATGLYQANVGQRFAPDDIVETPSGGGLQIQDGEGNSIALGHDTRVLLTRDAHIALLQGWVKVLHACDAGTATCTVPLIETAHTRFAPGDDTALVIAATVAGYPDDDAVFCESGTASVLAIGTSHGKAAPVRLDAHRFATHPNASDTIAVSARSDPAFVAAMPVAFRDALRVLPLPAHVRNYPASGIRPVAYDDVSDWLDSGLTARKDPATRFTTRFRARLSDPAFHHAIVQHVRELPDWRPLVFPPPRALPRNTAFQPRPAYSTDPVHP